VLDGLRRMLHPMRKEWEMVFVGSARQAMEALALEPFEVIVTDMRMPGTDGAELLEQVVRVYPEIVRIVLSGQWDAEMSIRSAKNAHQYLLKPCGADTLKATLSRIFEMRRVLTGRSLKRLVSGLTMLPSLPGAHRKLIDSLASPESTHEEIAGIVTADIALTAKVMQLANSAFFGVPREVTSPAEAIRGLGIECGQGFHLGRGTPSPTSAPSDPGHPR